MLTGCAIAGAAPNPVNTAKPGNPTPSTGLCAYGALADPGSREFEGSPENRVQQFRVGTRRLNNPVPYVSVNKWHFQM